MYLKTARFFCFNRCLNRFRNPKVEHHLFTRKPNSSSSSGETGGGEPRGSVFVLSDSDSVRAESELNALGNFCNSITQIDDSTTALWRLASFSSLVSCRSTRSRLLLCKANKLSKYLLCRGLLSASIVLQGGVFGNRLLMVCL